METTATLDQLRDFSFARHILDTPAGVNPNGFLSKFNIIESNKPTKVLKENEVLTRADFLAPGKTPTPVDNVFEEVSLTPKRVITTFELSSEFVQNTVVGTNKHLENLAARRIQSAIERMITGAGYKDSGVETNENMQILSEGQGKVSTKTKLQNTLEYSLIKSVYSEFVGYGNNPKTAFWLFSDTSTTVLDAQGNDIMTYDNVSDGAFAMLLGIPVYKASLQLSSGGKQIACVLVAPEAYTVLLGETYFQIPEPDTITAMKGSKIVKFEQYVDGKITNGFGRLAIEFA